MSLAIGVFPKLKLTYFDSPGRAESIRLLLFMAGIPFEDERLSREQFEERKAALPFGTLPVLEVDGLVLGEWQAIMRYVGRLTNTYPVNDPTAAVLVDEIFEAIEELGSRYMPVFAELDPIKKQAGIDQLVTNHIPRYLARIDARLEHLQAHPSFSAKPQDTLQTHELAIHLFMQAMLVSDFASFVPKTLVASYPQWVAIDAKVVAHPKVHLWRLLHHGGPKKLKLTWFGVAIRAEAIQLALHIGGIPFEGESLTPDEVAALAPSLPYNQVPILTIDGVVVAQSMALLRYAGTVSGLYPSADALACFKIDELFGPITEIYNTICPVFKEKDTAVQREMCARFVECTIPKCLGAVNKRVARWAAPYAMGAMMTIADLLVYALVRFFRSGFVMNMPANLLEPYPNVVALYELVLQHPKVHDWYTSHQLF